MRASLTSTVALVLLAAFLSFPLFAGTANLVAADNSNAATSASPQLQISTKPTTAEAVPMLSSSSAAEAVPMTNRTLATPRSNGRYFYCPDPSFPQLCPDNSCAPRGATCCSGWQCGGE